MPTAAADGTIPLPADRSESRKVAKRIDYERRQHGPNLTYTVGALGGVNPKFIP